MNPNSPTKKVWTTLASAAVLLLAGCPEPNAAIVSHLPFTPSAPSADQIAATPFASVYAGGAHTCALTAAGNAFCWGRGESGQLGVPVPTTTCQTDAGPSPCSMIPVPVQTPLRFVRLALGGAHTCGLLSDGTAFCWGNNGNGQLGDGTHELRDTPVPVSTGLKFASIDAGAAHTCGLTSAGEAYCWGGNDRGAVGDGTIVSRSAPTLVPGFTFQEIAAGGFLIGHTCGLAITGEAYCWGDNERGQLGVGSSDVLTHPIPLKVSTELIFASITAGLGRHSCGRTALGTAHCWGENTFGALGNETQEDSAIPVEVAGGHTFSQLIAGGFIGHTCALTATGAAHCWGENERGQVGDGTTFDRLSPTPVFGGLIFTSIDAGFRHTCGRDNTGALYCWGSNGAGQLGNNTNTQSNVPSKVFGPPILGLQLNQTVFHPGDTLVLTAMLTPGTAPGPVDGYVVIQLPDGTLLSLQPVGVVKGIAPIVRGFTPAPFSGTIFIHQFTGAEPPGSYSWFAALTQPGTLNIVGSIDQDSFTFSP